MEQEVSKEVFRGIILRQFMERRLLPWKLSNAELIIRGQELARLVVSIGKEEETQASQRKSMKDRLTEMALQLARLAHVVEAREEEREVIVVGDLVEMAEGPMVQMIRVDTGELIGYRRPTAQELQAGRRF